jgi:plasmid stabilization system protein ParE
MNLIYFDEAKAELAEAIKWYVLQSPPSAARFADCVADAIEEIVLTPNFYSRYELRNNPGNIRRARIKGFPYIVIYEVSDDAVKIVAVAHMSQRPGYWMSRLNP